MYNGYCGVMGYTNALDFEFIKDNIYKINKFEDICDFEHG